MESVVFEKVVTDVTERLSSFCGFETTLALCETSKSIMDNLESRPEVWINLGKNRFRANVSDEELANEIFRAKRQGRGSFYDDKPAGYFGRIYFIDMLRAMDMKKTELGPILADTVNGTVRYSQTVTSLMRRYKYFTLVTDVLAFTSPITIGTTIMPVDGRNHFDWDLVRHYGEMILAEWDYCQANGYEVGAGKRGPDTMIMGLYMFLHMARESSIKVMFDAFRKNEWCTWAYLGDELYVEVWRVLTEYYTPRIVNMDNEEVGFMFAVAGTLWFMRSKRWAHDLMEVWKQSERICVTTFAHRVAMTLLQENIAMKKKYAESGEDLSIKAHPSPFSDKAYEQMTCMLLNFYYQISPVLGDDTSDVRIALYVSIMQEVIAEFSRPVLSRSEMPECANVLMELLWQHQRIQRVTALNSNPEYRAACEQAIPLIEQQMAIDIDSRLVSNLTTAMGIPLPQPDAHEEE